MQVKDLIKDLEALHNKDQQVVIQVRGLNTIGPQGCTPVKGIMSGFDWDTGKLFIYGEISLGVYSE